MPKTNPHNEANLNPDNYTFYDFVDMFPQVPMMTAEAVQWMHKELDRLKDLLRDKSDSVYSPIGQCAHCGNHIRYHVLYQDVRTGAIIAVGQDCAQHRLDKSPAEWAEKKAKMDQVRALAAAGERRAALAVRFPEAMAVLADYDAARAQLHDDLDVRGQENEDVEARGGIGRGNSDLWKAFMAAWPPFIGDVAMKVNRYNDISEKQAAAIVKARQDALERIAQREQERANATPCPEGRMVVEGTVVSLKWKDSQWGGALKLTVKTDAGWLAWGTCPSALLHSDTADDGLKAGDRVQFTATVTPSDEDPIFGFFKRPTKATILETAPASGA